MLWRVFTNTVMIHFSKYIWQDVTNTECSLQKNSIAISTNMKTLTKQIVAEAEEMAACQLEEIRIYGASYGAFMLTLHCTNTALTLHCTALYANTSNRRRSLREEMAPVIPLQTLKARSQLVLHCTALTLHCTALTLHCTALTLH
jgi:hypothetical protein